jgi:TRAP-type mannitol/chloroaromatic compound transport system permease small subunit
VKPLLAIARVIDRVSILLAVLAASAVFLSCVVSAGNATIRYLFNDSSNAWLEIQWYLFGACVMLGAADVLRLNEHVRVDVLYGRLSGRGKAWVDLMGMCVFLLPVTIVIAVMAWPWFVESFLTHEMSNNAGGLVRWPLKLLLPLGFLMLALQGVSEIIKRIGHLTGAALMDMHYERPLQ